MHNVWINVIIRKCTLPLCIASYLDMELNLNDAGGPDPGVEDVLGGGDVAVLAQPSDVLQEVLGAVRQLILVGPQEGRL